MVQLNKLPMLKHMHKKHINCLSMLVISVALTACSGGKGDDIDYFLSHSGDGMKVNIKPLPNVVDFQAVVYNEDQTLVDPFKVRKNESKLGVKQPDMNRAKESLEMFPLESVKYVGMISKKSLTYALLKTPDNTIQQAKLGNYIGMNYGIVVGITEAEILLSELVQDDSTGDWVDRQTVIAIQE